MNCSRGFAMFALAVSIAGATSVAGCDQRPQSQLLSEAVHDVGETVRSGEVTVTLVSVSTTSAGMESTPAVAHLFLNFDVENATDASLTMPGPRGPSAPNIEPLDGSKAGVSGSGAGFTSGGGSWGIHSPGDPFNPYLNPGGVMHSEFGVVSHESVLPPARPFKVIYSPVSGSTVTFIVR